MQVPWSAAGHDRIDRINGSYVRPYAAGTLAKKPMHARHACTRPCDRPLAAALCFSFSFFSSLFISANK
jgi:hypothetical protein